MPTVVVFFSTSLLIPACHDVNSLLPLPFCRTATRFPSSCRIPYCVDGAETKDATTISDGHKQHTLVFGKKVKIGHLMFVEAYRYP